MWASIHYMQRLSFKGQWVLQPIPGRVHTGQVASESQTAVHAHIHTNRQLGGSRIYPGWMSFVLISRAADVCMQKGLAGEPVRSQCHSYTITTQNTVGQYNL